MAVTVSRTANGGYKVTIRGEEVTLPPKSKKTDDHTTVKFGTAKKYISVDVGPYEFTVVTGKTKKVIVAGEDEDGLDKRGQLYDDLETAWRNVPAVDSSSRLQKQTRRTKRNTGNNKGGKSKKLSTRRR